MKKQEWDKCNLLCRNFLSKPLQATKTKNKLHTITLGFLWVFFFRFTKNLFETTEISHTSPTVYILYYCGTYVLTDE